MKKGFTLIELLSTIVIIAVIALISVPVIRGLIQKIQLKALEDSAYGLVEAGNLYYAQFPVLDNVRFDKNENENTLKDLKHKGDVKSGTVIINRKGQVTVCASDGKNSAYKNYTDDKVILAARKTCTIPNNTYVVYLDNKKTMDVYTNEEITEMLDSLESKIINKIYPVGSIYLSTTDNTVAKVKARFGGTWEVYGDGRMIKSSTGASGTTGGNNTVTITKENIPSINVTGTTDSTGSGYSIGYASASRTTSTAGAHIHQSKDVHMYGTTGEIVGADYFASSPYAATTRAKWRDLKDSMYSAGNHSHTVTDYYANSISGVQAHTHTFMGKYVNSSQTKVNVENKYITSQAGMVSIAFYENAQPQIISP